MLNEIVPQAVMQLFAFYCRNTPNKLLEGNVRLQGWKRHLRHRYWKALSLLILYHHIVENDTCMNDVFNGLHVPLLARITNNVKSALEHPKSSFNILSCSLLTF
jgi:hypothetical protein